jgi:hypothetical protein
MVVIMVEDFKIESSSEQVYTLSHLIGGINKSFSAEQPAGVVP